MCATTTHHKRGTCVVLLAVNATDVQESNVAGRIICDVCGGQAHLKLVLVLIHGSLKYEVQNWFFDISQPVKRCAPNTQSPAS